ncbi:MAG: Ig-like domain-containing protein [Bacteroidota bacterium]
MKTKIFTLTLALCTLFAAGAYSQKPEGVIKRASAAPVIGGAIDAVWAEANAYNISLPFRSETPTLGSEGETFWKALWTPEGIYVLVQVADDEFLPAYVEGGPHYAYDLPEIFLDVNTTELEDGLGAVDEQGHYMFIPGLHDMSNVGTPVTIQGKDGLSYAVIVNNPDYFMEYFIPFSILKDKNEEIVDRKGALGFDVAVRDRDTGDNVWNRAVWANTGNVNESWNNMDDCGIITLDEFIQVLRINLTSEYIVTDNGTSQVIATIIPANASDQTLTWSVTNGTGRATIDNNGILTAIANGTVTVKAEANDGSGVTGAYEVIISNQQVTIGELNLIRNGNFDRVDEAGFPEEWVQFMGIQDREPFVQDGYLVLDPAQDLNSFYECQFGQQQFGCNDTSEYMFSFTAWSDEARTFQVDFEDPENQWIRYGTSDHEYAFIGESEWIFDVTAEPTRYSFYVVFDNMQDNTLESLQFQLGLSGVVTYIDSVYLVNLEDLPLLSGFNPVTSIIISSEGGATTLEKGETLQMSSELAPLDATNPDFRWSILPGTGSATISKDGVVTGTGGGTVNVVATARDGSSYTAEFELLITALVTSIKVTGEENATTVNMQDTLQMNALVMPEDATVSEVSWSVVSETGEATVNEKGLLTGVEAGTVIVMAFAQDESGIFGALQVEVMDNTGTESHVLKLLKAYPNPAERELNVVLARTSENHIVTIYNSVGNRMDQAVVNGQGHRFDISSYPAGLYFVRSRTQVVKFIK